MYLTLNEISRIQLDHTSRCNCMCPQCARVFDKRLNPSMPVTDLTVDDYKIILEPFEKNKITLFQCGNYGDAIVSPTWDETFEYCLNQNVKNVRISTNGSMRTPDWWRNFADKGKEKLSVVFSIDGLSNTNHLYRVGSNFEKIIENATAFINAGGRADWIFIEFEHNYHQIDEAKKIAKELGFLNFSVKYTARFAEQGLLEQENKHGQIIKDKKNNHNLTDKLEIEKNIIALMNM
jgi:MoaA/NifB/PqqE/SkfB family radical SAM enzyme